MIVQTGDRLLANVVTSPGVAFSGNCWSEDGHGRVRGSDDVVGDPRLTNPGSLTRADYRLAAGSPCAGEGARVDASTTAPATALAAASRAGLG